jgi:hypothetical protein
VFLRASSPGYPVFILLWNKSGLFPSNHGFSLFIDVFLSFEGNILKERALQPFLFRIRGRDEVILAVRGKDYDTVSFYDNDIFKGVKNVA